MLLIKFNDAIEEVPYFGSHRSNKTGVMLFNYGFIVSVSTSIRNPQALSFSHVENNVMVTLTLLIQASL